MFFSGVYRYTCVAYSHTFSTAKTPFLRSVLNMVLILSYTKRRPFDTMWNTMIQEVSKRTAVHRCGKMGDRGHVRVSWLIGQTDDLAVRLMTSHSHLLQILFSQWSFIFQRSVVNIPDSLRSNLLSIEENCNNCLNLGQTRFIYCLQCLCKIDKNLVNRFNVWKLQLQAMRS